jgi:signal transduction histidine kinase
MYGSSPPATIAAAGEWFPPRVHLDTISVATVVRHLFGVLDISLIAIALALLWLFRRSVLDHWLMATCCTLMLEIAMAIMLVNTRHSLSFYASRVYALIATILVLLLFLCETTILYAVRAQTMIRQRRERESRQVAMDSMAAAIAHELRQPLAAISADGNGAIHWMEKPDLEEARVSIKCVVSNAHHASEVIDGIRSLFTKDTRGRAWLDVNGLVLQVLKTVDTHLRTYLPSDGLN